MADNTAPLGPTSTPDAPGTEIRIFRHTLGDNFTILPNALLRDARLSARARGLIAYILSRPSGWRTTSTRLVADFTEGRDAIRAALTELETAGYLRRPKVHTRAENGQWQWVTLWQVTDDPTSWLDGTAAASSQVAPRTGFQASENQASENQASDFQASETQAPLVRTEDEGLRTHPLLSIFHPSLRRRRGMDGTK